MFTLVMVTAQADRYDGTPGHPAGVTPVAPAARLQLALQARGHKEAGGGRSFLCRALRDFRCCSGNHLREPPCILSQAPQGISRHGFPQFKCINWPGKRGAILTEFRLTSEGALVRTQLRPPGGLHVSVGPMFT